MSAPGITILVPSIGRMDYLPMTKRCVAEQTRRDFRVLVLDNASPPDAVAFFDAWAREDSRVEVLRVSTRVPMFANFNRGFRAATTELLTFFHDDDEYAPDCLEVLGGALNANPRAAFAGSNYDFIDEQGAIRERRRWITKTELWPAPRYVEELVGRGRNPVCMPGLVFRRSAFPDGFDETLPIHFGDFVLLMRAAEDGGMVAVADPVVRIRRHLAQASAIPLSKAIPGRTELMSRYLDEYVLRHPGDRLLVRRLRVRNQIAHRVAMLWGWMTAHLKEEREACLAGLGPTPLDAAMRGGLAAMARHGLGPERLGGGLRQAARTAAEALGF
jgi:glycosyltransferase involved in cell wall biosynthesis